MLRYVFVLPRVYIVLEYLRYFWNEIILKSFLRTWRSWWVCRILLTILVFKKFSVNYGIFVDNSIIILTVLVYSGVFNILWNRIFYNISNESRIFGSNSEIFQDVAENFIEHSGYISNVLEYSETVWNFVVSLRIF